MCDQIIARETVDRIISDIIDVKKSDLTKDGIYYEHSESNMLIGYALIYGQKNTPYSYGHFLFKLNFPFNYPYQPPEVVYLTNDGYTRFHQNYYKDGNVCLSFLNNCKINSSKFILGAVVKKSDTTTVIYGDFENRHSTTHSKRNISKLKIIIQSI